MQMIFKSKQVAKICGLTEEAVGKWYEEGLLQGYRMPGTLDTQGLRFPRDNLIAFMEAIGYDLAALENTTTTILLIGVDPLIRMQLADLFPSPKFIIKEAASGFEAGIMLDDSPAHIAVLDFSLGFHESTQVATNFRKLEKLNNVALILLLNDGETAPDGVLGDLTEALYKPILSAELEEEIMGLLDRRK